MSRRRAELTREGCVVTLTFHEPDNYAAMLLYDQIAEALQSGHLVIEVNAPCPSARRFTDEPR